MENTNNAQQIVIAIDGHSSTGKSTVAKEIAKKLNYIYVDTGAMYRAVTWFAIQQKHINVSSSTFNKKALIHDLDQIAISFQNISGKSHTLVNGIDVENAIRSLEVANWVSKVAAIPEVRKKLVAEQQILGEKKGIVMDGRDIGTVVFPEAELKIFMTADAQKRAVRRFEELKAKGEDVNYLNVLANIKERDYLDENRSDSPLKKADDAILIDNTNLTKEAQLNYMLTLVDTILKSK